MDFAKEFKLLAKKHGFEIGMDANQQVGLCRPLKGTWFPLVSFPGTAVPGSGFLRPFRDWFAEKICGRTGLEVCQISRHCREGSSPV
jgi:hypothetical protein